MLIFNFSAEEGPFLVFVSGVEKSPEDRHGALFCVIIKIRRGLRGGPFLGNYEHKMTAEDR